MLHHPTVDKLQALRFTGMLKALQEQQHLPDIDALSFEERLGLLADRELTEREDRRLQTRLRQAKLKQSACLEDIDYRTPRGLDKGLVTQLATGQWIRDGLNAILVGPTGVGKTWIGCALAQHACRQGYTVRYLRLPRLFEELRLAHADGRFPKLMNTLAKTDLLLLDDWGLATLDTEARRDLLELLDTYPPIAMRLFYFRNHYRKPVEFTDESSMCRKVEMHDPLAGTREQSEERIAPARTLDEAMK